MTEGMTATEAVEAQTAEVQTTPVEPCSFEELHAAVKQYLALAGVEKATPVIRKIMREDLGCTEALKIGELSPEQMAQLKPIVDKLIEHHGTDGTAAGVI